LCVCVFKETDDLFRLLEDIKTIERIHEVAWSEEVRSIDIQEKFMSLGVRLP